MSEKFPTTGDDMYCIFQGKAQGHHFVPTGTIQGSHIHTTFDLTGKTVTLPNGTLSHSTTKAVGDSLLRHLQLQVVER